MLRLRRLKSAAGGGNSHISAFVEDPPPQPSPASGRGNALPMSFQLKLISARYNARFWIRIKQRAHLGLIRRSREAASRRMGPRLSHTSASPRHDVPELWPKTSPSQMRG